MKITVIGTGYVGLVTGACFAEMGYNVACVDSDSDKIARLKNGVIPIYEPDLEPLVVRNSREGRLTFTSSVAEAAADTNVFFIAVGTPSRQDGSVELKYVREAASQIGRELHSSCLVVNKSTVPVGTADELRKLIDAELSRRGINVEVDVVSNPEFLKEGNAVNDCMHPDRVIIGADNARTTDMMRALYAPFLRKNQRVMVMSTRDAEMTKYAANAMLATRISFMNEIANLCERVGADVENVRVGIGADSRIGYSFIYPGCGYGGACFPKDLRALIRTASDAGIDPMILKAVEMRNQSQKRSLFEKIRGRFGSSLAGHAFAVWGLSYKPGTDDMREAPSIELLNQLIDAGATVRAYDPVAVETARRTLPKEWFERAQLELTNQQNDSLSGADAMVLVTEWKQFRAVDLPKIKTLMKRPVIFDGRNQYDPAALRAEGFEYYGIGR